MPRTATPTADTPTPPAPGALDTPAPPSQLATLPAYMRRQMGRIVCALAREGTISAACRAARLSHTTYYRWLATSPDFAAAVGAAQAAHADMLEGELYRRAVEGDAQPVFHNGVQVGERVIKSDNLLMFALKGARPGKYKEKLLDPSDLVTLLQRLRQAAGNARGDAINAQLGVNAQLAVGVLDIEATEVEGEVGSGGSGEVGSGEVGSGERGGGSASASGEGSERRSELANPAPARSHYKRQTRDADSPLLRALLGQVYSATRPSVPRETLEVASPGASAPSAAPATPASTPTPAGATTPLDTRHKAK